MQLERRAHYDPEEILVAVQDKVEKVTHGGESIDYLTFVADGEPTLDIDLGHEIELLKPLGIKIAVITNASLMWREDVRKELLKADLVSLKIDSVKTKFWRRVNRPLGTLQLSAILDGTLEFAKAYGGELVTETMLVKGLNESPESIEEVSDLLTQLQPATAYLAVVTRPPAEAWVQSPGEEAVNRAYQIFSKRVDHVEYLIGYEGNAFAFTGNVEKDLLDITAVHPMRDEAVDKLLARAKAGWSVVHKLIADNQLIEMEYETVKFYMRRLH